MAKKTIPFSNEQIRLMVRKFPTPFHVYDEEGIRMGARSFYSAFSWAPGFKNYFAVKALPNPHILKILKEEGMGADCSSLPELIMAEKAGFIGENIMFTSNDTPIEEFVKAMALGAFVNLDDIKHLEFLEEKFRLPDVLCFRYNPGSLREGNGFIGKPEESKYGLTREQLFKAYALAKERGVRRFGLHTMVASNELNPDYFIETARMLFELVVQIYKELGLRIEFVNLGGGIGIAYKPEQQAVDLVRVSHGIRDHYEKYIIQNDLDPLNIVMECGRLVTGPYGFLVTTVRHVTQKYRDYVGLDACMANLMRPALYGAYHHITVLGKENHEKKHVYDVTGSLCENNDKFAIQRLLPEIVPGDILIIHDTGAHGYGMGFQYNGKLRSSEILVKPDGAMVMIRRAETVEDYFSTLDFSSL